MLQLKGEQSMAIVTFGSRGEESRVCEVVNVCMQLRSGGIRDLTVFVVLAETGTHILQDFPSLIYQMGQML